MVSLKNFLTTSCGAPANSPSRTREDIRRMNCRKPLPMAPVVSKTSGVKEADSTAASSAYLAFFAPSRFRAAARGREAPPTARAEREKGWVIERSNIILAPSRNIRRSGLSHAQCAPPELAPDRHPEGRRPEAAARWRGE